MFWLSPALAADSVEWREWGPEVFATAATEHKLVLLHVGAVWCHWCHVMEHDTYADPAVAERLARSFVAVRIDQDAQPDVSQRYEDWGWPATILLRPDGTELAKLRGFVPPQRFTSLLDAFVADPTPGPSAIPDAVPRRTALDEETRAALAGRFDAAWDEAERGWGRITKQVDWTSQLWAFTAGQVERATRAVTLQHQLLDPAWGGVYQYSERGIWTAPHFEKLASFQAEALQSFAFVNARDHRPADREAALSVARYIDRFLWDPSGGYRASQDADLVAGEHSAEYFALPDGERVARGIPRVDPGRYARENGLLAAALARASGWLGAPELVDRAEEAARFAIRERGLPGGGFAHGDDDVGGPWLADTLAMGEAFAALYEATADPRWLRRAVDALDFVERRFRDPEAGYRASASGEGIPGARPLRHRDENARLARLAAWVAVLDPGATPTAEHALRLVAGLAEDGAAPAVLLADHALRSAPLHLVVRGSRHDPAASALHAAALARPDPWRVVDWRSARRSDGFPPGREPAVFVCGDGWCSAPIRSATELAAVDASRAP